jgi:hypothetical protein
MLKPEVTKSLVQKDAQKKPKPLLNQAAGNMWPELRVMGLIIDGLVAFKMLMIWKADTAVDWLAILAPSDKPQLLDA